MPRSRVKSPLSVRYSVVDFARSLKVDGCRLTNTPNLIFLCGGKIAEQGKYRSARDYFNRNLQKNGAAIAGRVKLAEEVYSWFQNHKPFAKYGPFSDLLELENHLAHLADAVVLFVESPGSIAELGAFANSDVLRPKTLAILNRSEASGPSFISDGPVQKIINEDRELVHYYTWDPANLNADETTKEFAELTTDLTEFLERLDAKRAKQPSLKPQDLGHALVLVADFVRVPGVATKNELLECLRLVGCDTNRESIDRCLHVLESLGLIRSHLRSNQTFYVRASEASYVRYAYADDARLRDWQRIVTTVRNSHESIKKSVLRHALRELKQGES